MKISDTPQRHNLSRRDFVKGSTVAGLASLLTNTNRIYATGSDKIRVGIIGCGRRGIFDAKNCVNSSENVVITAMGDLFADKLENCRNYLTEKFPDKVQVTDENCFVGWDAYKDVLKTDIDLVILTETPHFRAAHLRAAVEAGKHVFMEKPVAIDPVGVRSVIESSRLAEEKKLTILAGTQLRRISHIVEIIKRIHRGDIGEIISGQYVRIGDAMLNWGPDQRDSKWSDMEWQIRNWLFHTWLSGHFIVENVWNNLFVDPHHIAYFVDSFHSPYVRAYFDIGNHVKYSPPEDWIRILGRRIVKCHVKDFKLKPDGHGGKFTNIRQGSVDWPKVMAALRRIGYNGWMTIEGSVSLSLEERSKRLDLILAADRMV